MAGSPVNNRKLADQLRAKLLIHANKIMDGDDEEAKNKLLEKMGNALLPRLTEVTGENGGELKIKATLVKFLDE